MMTDSHPEIIDLIVNIACGMTTFVIGHYMWFYKKQSAGLSASVGLFVGVLLWAVTGVAFHVDFYLTFFNGPIASSRAGLFFIPATAFFSIRYSDFLRIESCGAPRRNRQANHDKAAVLLVRGQHASVHPAFYPEEKASLRFANQRTRIG
jgi:hypothetical protein